MQCTFAHSGISTRTIISLCRFMYFYFLFWLFFLQPFTYIFLCVVWFIVSNLQYIQIDYCYCYCRWCTFECNIFFMFSIQNEQTSKKYETQQEKCLFRSFIIAFEPIVHLHTTFIGKNVKGWHRYAHLVLRFVLHPIDYAHWYWLHLISPHFSPGACVAKYELCTMHSDNLDEKKNDREKEIRRFGFFVWFVC